MMGKQLCRQRQPGQMDLHREADRQTRTDHTVVYKVLRYSLIGSPLSLSLRCTKCLYAKSSQSNITMMCKSIINYKYSIASLQSATEIGADNLQKRGGKKGLICL